jgi:hypothetical protein
MIKNLIFLFVSCSLVSCNSNAQKQDDYAYKISLEKLHYITGHLEDAVKSMRRENKNLLKRITQEVSNKGNISFDLEAVNKGKKIVQLTDVLFEQIASIKSELLILSGQDLSSVIEQNSLMLDQDKGVELETAINDYVKEINTISNKKHALIFPKLEGTKYSIVELYFKDSPVIATLGTILSLESEICNYEREVLAIYAAETGTR